MAADIFADRCAAAVEAYAAKFAAEEMHPTLRNEYERRGGVSASTALNIKFVALGYLPWERLPSPA